MRVYEAIAKESAGRFSVGDDVSIADLCLVAMIQQAVSRFGMRFDKFCRYPTVRRIVRTCEGIDAFRQQGCLAGLRSRGPTVPADKPAASWPGLEPRSTRSRESSPDTGSFDDNVKEAFDRAAKTVESRLQRTQSRPK